MNNQECEIKSEIININSNESSMSRTNEIRHIKQHETSKCKRILDIYVCNNKHQNKDKYRCGCKELIDKEICDKGFIWDPSSCGCECDKLCNVGELLDYKNCKCRKKLIDKLLEKCSKIIHRNEMICNTTINEKICNLCTLCIV